MKNDELLGAVHKNAEMGLLTVPKILEKSNDLEFSKCLSKKEKEYSRIYDATKQAAETTFDKEAKLGTFEKLRTEIMIDINTAVDTSVSHLADDGRGQYDGSGGSDEKNQRGKFYTGNARPCGGDD